MFKQEFDDELYEASEKRVSRSVYIIVYWEGAHIKNKIERICDSFQGQRFELPAMQEIQDQMNKTRDGINGAKNVWMETKKQLRD